MRIAIVGAAGQLGSDLLSVFSDAIPLTHADIDITSPEHVHHVLGRHRPELVINCAAYNLVDRAEDEPQQAYAVNALGPRILAQWCETQIAKLVHFSTDYVFGADSARSTPYHEEDTPGPLSMYGSTKLDGEGFVRADCSRHLILRTCGLYGLSETRAKGNFVTTMLRLAGKGGPIRVVDDQICTPTFTSDLAVLTQKLIAADAQGLFHATNAGQTSWYGLAAEVFRRKNLNIDLQPISTAEYDAKARRPSYSVLNCERSTETSGWKMPTWESALERYLCEFP